MKRLALAVPSSRLVLACWLAIPSSGVADDFGTWNGVSVKTLDTKYVALVSSAEFRLYEDSSTLRQYQLTQMVVIKANPYLGLGVNYTYQPTRPPGSDDFLTQQRIELEAIPRWPVTDRLTLDFRQRLELIWTEGHSGITERSRHRVQATYALTGFGPLTSIFASDEVFYDYDQNELNQNRLVPLGLGFRISAQVGLKFYYMLQSVDSATGWQNASIIGTQLSLSF